jgi:purine-nucleoside phosphorylase
MYKYTVNIGVRKDMKRFITADNLPAKILLTDDVMRVRMIAAHYIENAVLLFELRGAEGYKGTFKQAEIAVISCGFGQSASRLYLAEAVQAGARECVYLGECIAVNKKYALMDIITDCSDVFTNDMYWLDGIYSETHGLVDFAAKGVLRTAKELGITASVVLVVSEDADNQRIEESVRQSRLYSISEKALNLLTKQ